MVGLIGWVDVEGTTFVPKWERMKAMIHVEYKKGLNKGTHTVKTDWSNGDEGSVWTEVDMERLKAYGNELPSTYCTHLKTISMRVGMAEEMCPGKYLF